MLAVSQVFNHLRYRRRTQRQCQPFVRGAEIDDQGDFRAFDVLEKNQGKFVLPLELFDDGACFVDRIDFFIDDDHVSGPLFQQFI